MTLRVNIGCGQSPTPGWRNLDNSLSLRLSRVPLLPSLCFGLGLLDRSQCNFIRFARRHDIEYGDATKGLALQEDSVDVLYSSHMLEHLDRDEASVFLKEAYRVLRPGGIIRIAVPDIAKHVKQYNEAADADAFIEATHLCVPRPRSLAQRLSLALVGSRHHQWMYDGRSLSGLLEKSGFAKVREMPLGKTRIHAPEPLDLGERGSESVYVEAEKPAV